MEGFILCQGYAVKDHMCDHNMCRTQGTETKQATYQ